ncbi:MAG: beta-CASP ribonuclease aCPSF1 [Candidatus Heimdallarchaeota archaeon]|nr:beta-CASP ribonuclease aCPSF1 [Candidatus Heimdallarchaeota archaeon]
MSSERNLVDIEHVIYELVPKRSEITRVEFEGPEVAIYSNNFENIIDSDLISNIARTIKKRVVFRSDPSIRLPYDEAKMRVLDLFKGEVEIGDIYFDDILGEIIIHVDSPGQLIGKNRVGLNNIIEETKWRPRVLRIPPVHSDVIESIRNVLLSDHKGRSEALKKIGKKIHRQELLEEKIIRVTGLGGYQEVGRSSTLLTTGDANILIDCGVSVGNSKPSMMLPRFDFPEFDIADLDCVVLSHAHLDHVGFVPFLFKYGYEGPIFTTAPTRDLMTMLQIDYLDIAEKEGKLLPYSKLDIRKSTLHTITLKYGEVTDIAPGIKLTFHNAGHIVGSSIVHLHVGNGKYNLAFAHDFKFANSRLLDRAVNKFPRLEAMIMESTYGNPEDNTPSRAQTEDKLAEMINSTLTRGGKVLIPVLAVGRAQELQLVIEHLIVSGRIPEVPVFLDGMIKEATAVTSNHPEFLSRKIRERILNQGDNPFLAPFFHTVNDNDARNEIINGYECIIMATSGMLVGGPSVHYFQGLAEESKNTIIFVSYQGKGTLGRKISEGLKEVKVKDEKDKTVLIRVNMDVHRISGFTGHSDRKELMEYAKRLSPRPKKYLFVHGEASKCQALAKHVAKIVKRETEAPSIGSTVRLY